MNSFAGDFESDIETSREEYELEDVFGEEDDLQGLIEEEEPGQTGEVEGRRVPRYRSRRDADPSRRPIV